MPLREQEFRELCAQPGCNELPRHQCLRCGRPLCEGHFPADPNQRCDDCEAEYREESAAAGAARGKQVVLRLVSILIGGVAVLIGGPIAVAVLTRSENAAVATLALLFLGGIPLLFLLAARVDLTGERGSRRRRAAFLKQRL